MGPQHARQRKSLLWYLDADGMSYFRLSTLGVRTKPPRVLLFLLLHLTQIRVRRLPPHGSRTAKSRRNEVVYTNARNPSRNQRRQRGSFPPTSSRWFRCFDTAALGYGHTYHTRREPNVSDTSHTTYPSSSCSRVSLVCLVGVLTVSPSKLLLLAQDFKYPRVSLPPIAQEFRTAACQTSEALCQCENSS